VSAVQRDHTADARVLREAAGVLLLRARRQTLWLRAVIMRLEYAARDIEQGGAA
jgi:hypothetical protein